MKMKLKDLILPAYWVFFLMAFAQENGFKNNNHGHLLETHLKEEAFQKYLNEPEKDSAIFKIKKYQL